MTAISHLAPAPDTQTGPVKSWVQPLLLPTYEPAPADKNPMFLEKRVYQGSSGQIYPLPFTDRVASEPVEREWEAIFVENDYLRVIILPELGGRIYAAIDKVNGYDIIYRNHVIKPALVGLAGPWVSGGIEFNWPQHHRPSTYLPVDWTIEEHEDGARTVWLGEHEPMNRMKGIHGVQLRPDVARFDILVRLYNRTCLTQTIMWWANAAAEVNEHYQSFFPSDVSRVADHAKRAMIDFPHCNGHYYGVDYGGRAQTDVPEGERPRQFVPDGAYPAHDLRWYSNIPVPTSYMCVDSTGSFFGGYDYAAQAGMVHVADRHVSPGKKQWTWGNHEFGYAWDRNLTDPDENGIYRPYIELMAGVFTDNQPDFSFIAPGETKTFVQHWYAIREIGPADEATEAAAVNVRVDGTRGRVGLHAVEEFSNARIVMAARGEELRVWSMDLGPQKPIFLDFDLPETLRREDLSLVLQDEQGKLLLEWGKFAERFDEPTQPATEPPAPEAIESLDELFITGVHLSQYRHATRMPELYWLEALKRDPSDSRCNNAIGLWYLRRGEFEAAEACFKTALKRLRLRNPNPIDGEPFYNLGLTLGFMGQHDAAFDAFGKASWDAAFFAPGHLAMAEIAATKNNWREALQRVDAALRVGMDNLKARNLKGFCLRALGRDAQANALFRETLAIDPLDYMASDALGKPLSQDPQILIDLALDYARMGDAKRALDLTSRGDASVQSGAKPIMHYCAAYFADQIGLSEEATKQRRLARQSSSDYCFPCRLDEIAILQAAIKADPSDAMARYYLGNLLYDKKRFAEGISMWEQSVAINPDFSIPWRNLGIGYHNVEQAFEKAEQAYERAFAVNPEDARLFYERDQLWKRLGKHCDDRLGEFEAHLALVSQRDDLIVELVALYNQTGRSDLALEHLNKRHFQPWEGGEGLVLEQYVRACIHLGLEAIDSGNIQAGCAAFDAAMTSPVNLGEARHLLANQSDAHYWAGVAYDEAGEQEIAQDHWQIAADFKGDFLEMEARAFSEKSYYSILAMKRLGRQDEALRLCDALDVFAKDLLESEATIDYFATSLPTMLIFNDDIQVRQSVSAYVMLAQVALVIQDFSDAAQWLEKVRKYDPYHGLLPELSRALSLA